MRVDELNRLRDALATHYRVERELGRGATATVYLAHDLKHRRNVAIKVLKSEIASSIGAARFLREIEIASALTHPHILPLHDSGEADGFLYYVMPYIEGESLRQRLIREKQLRLDDAVEIARDAADALAYAHRHGIVHRDIKPENILLQDRRAIVADFGIARAITRSATDPSTSTGLAVGTAPYMSPEQGFASGELDGRSDVYALGCVLYEMLAGETPFTGPNPQAIIARHACADVPSIRIVRPMLTEEVEDLLRAALAKVPADRIPSADHFEARLRTLARAPKRRTWPISWQRVAVTCALLAVTVAATVVWRQAFGGALREHDWLLVTDFESPPSDPDLADAVRELATTAFEQSRYLRILPRRQLNDAMRLAGVPETTRVDAQLGRQLALRSSVRAMLMGSVRQLGADEFSIVLHVLRADETAEIASAAGTTTPQDLVVSVQALAADLRRQLGEQRKAIEANRPLRDVATPSFDAFRKYSLALDLAQSQANLTVSNRLLLDAIAADSGFASAWAALGANFLTARQLDSARWAYERALARPERLSPAQRYRLQGDVAYALDHDLEAAVRWYDLFLAEVPHSRGGWSNRALYLSGLGRYEDALAALRSSEAVNRFGSELAQPTLLNLGAMLVVLGRVDELDAVTKQLSGPFLQYLTIIKALAESRWAAVESLAVHAGLPPANPPGFLRIHATTALASALAAQGAVQSADSVLRTAAIGSRGATARWYERARLLLAVVARDSVGPRPDLAGDTLPAATALRALWSAVAGDVSSARRDLAHLQNLPPRELAVTGRAPLLAASWIAGREGRWRSVVDTLAAIARGGEHDPTFLDRPESFSLRWLVAVAYEHLAERDSAVAFFNAVLEPTAMPPGHYALRGIPFAFAHRRLATLHQQLGHADSAEDHWRIFRQTITRADSTVAQLLATRWRPAQFADSGYRQPVPHTRPFKEENHDDR